MKKNLLILLCALGLPIAMSAQLQERKASKMLDGMRTVNTAGKYNAPAKEGEEEPTPVELVAPMYLTVVETGNNWAKTDWLPVADESEWKIRLTQPFAAGSQTWGFDDGTVGEWTNVDADGDGRKWINVSGTSYEAYCYDSNGAIVSQSYYNGALTPDNWLISPQVTLGGTFTLYARGQGAPYEKEHFGVFVSTTDTETASFTQVGETIETTDGWTQYFFDLSAYEGQQGYIAVRHFDCTDMNILCVDEFALIPASSVEVPETIIEPVTEHPYTITGLEAGMTYEIQVAAVRDGEVSDWSGAVRFKTTNEAGQMPVDVAVNEVTDKTAEVTWVGNDGEQFNVRYREYLEFPTFTWDFEEGIEGWTQIDADGDGKMWTHHLNTGSGNYLVNSGVGSINSASYDSGDLTPDNWMISPEVELGASVSLWAGAQDPKWPKEHFAVYVTTGDPTNTENFVEVIPESVATGGMTQYTGNTSEYAGQMGYVAIRHFNCKGQFYLVVDDVTIIYPREDGRTEPEWTVAENATSPHAIEGLAPETEYEVQVQTVGNEEWTESVRFTTLEQQAEQAVTPTEVTEQEVGEDYATIGWTGNGETSWNVRYRKHVENSLWDFEEGAEGWTMIDADGDGFEWLHVANDGNKSHSGSGVMTSISYNNTNGSALTPDNWLVSPEVALDGTLTFWAVGQDLNYAAEHFAVYASTGDPTNTASFVEIMPETVATGEITEYTVDLTAYAGQKGYIAFRHFNCTDMFRLNIDDVTITVPEYEWTVVEGITENPYTIEGLEGGVAYDFQVQAIGEAGDVSEWSETLTFTTSMPDAIVEVASETTANNVWYNINGARLNGKPTQKGIYILNGKKVMVK